jgi:hypothetical protein
VVTAVATFGIANRDRGTVGFTTSLGFPPEARADHWRPQVALAYHAREHGFSALPRFVLAQGRASVDLQPPRERVQAIIPQAERYYRAAQRGPVGPAAARVLLRAGLCRHQRRAGPGLAQPERRRRRLAGPARPAAAAG